MDARANHAATLPARSVWSAGRAMWPGAGALQRLVDKAAFELVFFPTTVATLVRAGGPASFAAVALAAVAHVASARAAGAKHA